MDDRVAAKVQKKTKSAWQARSDNKLRFFVGLKETRTQHVNLARTIFFFPIFRECVFLEGFGECGMLFFCALFFVSPFTIFGFTILVRHHPI